MADMQFEKFDPGVDLGHTEDVVIEDDGSPPEGHRGTLEAALGMEQDMELEPPDDPDVRGFLDVVDGKPVSKEAEPSEGSNSQFHELVEANKRLASQLGKQGNEIIGPLRQQVEQQAAELAALRAQMGQSQQPQMRQHEVVADTIRNLYGPDADVEDPAFIKHAQAHINAGNRLGQAVEEQYIKPLTDRIEQLQARLEEAQANTGMPQEQQEALLQQYPSLKALPPKERASVMRDLARTRPQPGTHAMDPSQYVEPTMPTAPVKTSSRRQVEAFDALDTEKQGAALGQMLARRGLGSLGR